MDPQGAVALVTGGAHRVGKGIVLALAAAGADVFIHYGRSADAADATAAEARALGGRAAVGVADLDDPSSGAQLVEMAEKALGATPSILVNSASSFPEDSLASVTAEGLEAMLRIGVVSPAMLTQALAGRLGQNSGAVVNVTDWRTARPYPDRFSYIVAKGALDEVTRAAAVALAPRIRVNAVALGAILPPPGKDSAYLKVLATSLPLQRTGGVEVVAETVLYLIRNDFVTGEIIRVDGGAHLT